MGICLLQCFECPLPLIMHQLLAKQRSWDMVEGPYFASFCILRHSLAGRVLVLVDGISQSFVQL